MKDIAVRVPVDKTAARVTSAGPKGVESAKQILQVCSPTPLPLRRVSRSEIANPRFEDLTGRQRGQLTVVGLSADTATARAMWVCRCVCGYYTTRRGRSILNAANDCDRCERCREVVYLRRVTTFRQLGYNPDESESL